MNLNKILYLTLQAAPQENNEGLNKTDRNPKLILMIKNLKVFLLLIRVHLI